MRYLLNIIFLTSLILTGCVPKKKDSKVSPIAQTNNVEEVQSINKKDVLKKEKVEFIDDRFKFGHIKSFTPNSYQSQDLKLIDSIYFVTIIKQIESFTNDIYEPKIRHHFISKQKNIGRLRAETVSLYWDLCYEGIELLIVDQNDSLINHIPLTEWRSTCESSSNTNTEFITDSTFVQHIEIMEPGVESNFFTELKYKGLINHYGQLDTLEILVDKEYEQEITPHNNLE